MDRATIEQKLLVMEGQERQNFAAWHQAIGAKSILAQLLAEEDAVELDIDQEEEIGDKR